MSTITTKDGTEIYFKDWGHKGGTHSLGDTHKDRLNADLLAFLRGAR